MTVAIVAGFLGGLVLGVVLGFVGLVASKAIKRKPYEDAFYAALGRTLAHFVDDKETFDQFVNKFVEHLKEERKPQEQ